ncbi:hypothetical protein SAMN04515674_105308 [Pseudarcicella hirudinis]|uniref:Uncharacterized protein n=1 Tax=Pseudarcicella hirudinis TaxID=1079859 RepID=A0A1I5T0F1_9BACT|nr:hypothetical protein [Pseudarcicella hirudinis]SFP76502.1 hypothetical protein SAMN04515674_105308 [Pseudarcicella hirudinis]
MENFDINKAFDGYAKLSYPIVLTKDQDTQLRQAFFAGISLLIQSIENQDCGIEDFFGFSENIHSQCLQYWQQVAKSNKSE